MCTKSAHGVPIIKIIIGVTVEKNIKDVKHEIESDAKIDKILVDRAFWKIDAMVGLLFDAFVARDKLPTHDKYHGRITCRGLYPKRRANYDNLYYESVEKSCERIKRDNPLDYQALVDEHGSEQELISAFKYS
jgi:hypothetical protein